MSDRRTFLKSVAAVAVAGSGVASRAGAQTAPAAGAAQPAGIRKSILINMLPKELPYAERFALARTAGFEAIEMQTISSPDEAAEIREGAVKAGLRVHSVMNSDHWRLPLSSADPDVVKRSVQGMETSLRNAKLWGADAVLLVPAVVDPKTRTRTPTRARRRSSGNRSFPSPAR